jgi:hypothetical protein
MNACLWSIISRQMEEARRRSREAISICRGCLVERYPHHQDHQYPTTVRSCKYCGGNHACVEIPDKDLEH